MAGNMQQMPGAAQIMPQQMQQQMQQQQIRKPNNAGLQQIVYNYLVNNTPPPNGATWQSNVPIGDRLGRTMNLISNIALGMGNADFKRAAEFGCKWEADTFASAQTREAYDQIMANKTAEFFKKREANQPGLQNSLNNSGQAMVNMQNQMGRGMNQMPQQGFQHLQHQMQASQISQQQQPQQQQQQNQNQNRPQQQQQMLQQQSQQQQLQQQQQQQLRMAMNMGNQAGRGVAPNQQMMGAQNTGGQPRSYQQLNQEMGRLASSDKQKIAELASKMLINATEETKAATRARVQQQMTPEQLAEFQQSSRDPLVWFYQAQAFQILRMNMDRFQDTQNPNAAQSAMMQPQGSQQNMQQRQNMMNAGQTGAGGNGFPQFNPNMESIKDQQMTGLMAQQAGQTVVPASSGPGRNPTPQPANQTMSNQQNQTPNARSMQQQQGFNLQEMKPNQTAQQSQAQLNAQNQFKMQGQQGMTNQGMQSQGPGMNTLNTPASRPNNNLNQMAQGNNQFGDQRFNQRPNSDVYNTMLASMSNEQRASISTMPPDKVNEIMARWQASRQNQMAMNARQLSQQQQQQQQQHQQQQQQQMQNRQPNQMDQVNANAAAQTQGISQGGAGANGNMQQQMRVPPGPANQAQLAMDNMDLPPPVTAQVNAQIGQLPPEVKKWRDLKQWLQHANITANARSQLAQLQQKQFMMLMQRRASMQQGFQQGQQPPQMQQMQQIQQQMQQQQQGVAQQMQQANPNPALTPGGMANRMGQMGAQQQNMQRQMVNFPPHVLQVTAQDIMQVRSQRPSLAEMTDDQMRPIVLQMKKQQFAHAHAERMQQAQLQQQSQMAQQAQQAQAQAQARGQQGQQFGQNQALMQQRNQMQRQQQQQQSGQVTPQPQTQGTSAPAKTPASQASGKKQSAATPKKAPGPSPAQTAKNLKRPSTDDTAANAAAAKNATSGPQAQPNQQRQLPQLTPQQLSQMTPEQQASYEEARKMQMAAAAAKGPSAQFQEAVARLRTMGQEAQAQFAQEKMVEVDLSPTDYKMISEALKKTLENMVKVGKGLSKWFLITGDEQRAKLFFKFRLRMLHQFADGDEMKQLKDKLSIGLSELQRAGALLGSMANDFKANVARRSATQQHGQAGPNQVAHAEQPQQGQSQAERAPLNAANLEKNTQALNKAQKPASKSGKGSSVPVAPTTAQPPFQFGASSPHGNPSYIGKAKDLNLQLPPARKKQKLAGQGTPGSQASPPASKAASPEARRAPEPPKPVYTCKEPDCDMADVGFVSEQALATHAYEEHTKPREDPIKYAQESLALALGLEPDGSAKKNQKAPNMSTTMSKQGQTPGSQAPGKAADGQTTTQTGKDGSKQTAAAAADPWANSTIDPQALVSNLGFHPGVPGVCSDMNVWRHLTAQDTPESSKDSGSSEPNSDLSEGVALNIDVNWQTLDADLLLDMDNANLGGDAESMEDADRIMESLLSEKPRMTTEWDEVDIDFSKPFQIDPSFYSMDF